MHQWHTPFRFVIGAACAAFILFVRPVTPGMILWTAILGIGAVILLELFSRPATETMPAEPSSERVDPKETHA